MSLNSFRCPVCKGPLVIGASDLRCAPCGRAYPIVDGIPDLFVSQTESDHIDEPNKTWLDPEIVEARDTIYSLCARELRGMAFCMRRIGQQTGPGCRILEVGMGTGHFTQWLAEVSRPGTGTFAFDFSWPIIEKAKARTQDLAGVTLFRANARGRLPFADESFDVVLARLAPLGAHGTSNAEAACKLLRPGGWYYSAGWDPVRYEIPPTEWAVRHGYESAEQHEWQYWRPQTERERAAWRTEQGRVAAQYRRAGKEPRHWDPRTREDSDGFVQVMTREHVVIAQRSSRG